jgi:putative hydrolase
MSVERIDCSRAIRDVLTRVPAWDCHLHTCHDDGQGDLARMITSALRRRLERIVFTAHTESIAGRPENWFERYRQAVQEAKQAYAGRLEILLGVEAPAADNTLGILATDEILKHAEFVLGAAHRYPKTPARLRTRDLGADDLRKLETETALMLCENPHIDAIAHVGGTCSAWGAPLDREAWRLILRRAAARRRAVEINARYHRPLAGVLPLFAEAEVRVTLGSDAHRPEDAGLIVRLLRSRGRRRADG